MSSIYRFLKTFPAKTYLFRVNNGSNVKYVLKPISEICSKVKITVPE